MTEGKKVGAMIKMYREETKNLKEEEISIAIKINQEVRTKRIIEIIIVALLIRAEMIAIDLNKVRGDKDQDQFHHHLHHRGLLIQSQDQDQDRDQRAVKNIKDMLMIGEKKEAMIGIVVAPGASLQTEIQKG